MRGMVLPRRQGSRIFGSLGDCGWRVHSSAADPVPEESEMFAQAPRPLFVVAVACLLVAFAVGCGGGDNNQTSVFVEGGGPPLDASIAVDSSSATDSSTSPTDSPSLFSDVQK